MAKLDWLKNLIPSERVFTSIAAIATTIGVIFVAIQIRDTRKTLEATTVYNIQKDARDLGARLNQEPFFSYLTAYNPKEKYPDDLQKKARAEISQAIQFYSTVYNQRREGVISDAFWPTFGNEICGFLRYEPVRRFWNDQVLPGKYNPEFKEFGNKCLSQTPSGERAR